MSSQGSITQWLEQIEAGESAAAQMLWQRYYERLVALARRKLRDVPCRVADEEDVALSAFDCFFKGVEAGRFPKLDDRDDLWRILVTLTANKALDQIRHQTRQKRGGGRVRGESVFVKVDALDEPAGIDQVVGSEPTPEFAAEVAANCRELIERLDDETLQKVALGKMEGLTNEEIARDLGCTVRTVARKLKAIRTLWVLES